MSGLAAMVLAAGLGTRLRPLTEQLAKPACPVLGRPLLEFPLSRLAPLAPDRVVVNLHHLPATVENVVAARPFGLPLVTVFEPKILGTGGGLKNARDLLADADVIVLLNGDTVCDADLTALVAAHRASDVLATLLLLDDVRIQRYGAIEVDADGAIVDFAGLTGKRGTRRGIFVGAHALSPRIFDHLPKDDVFCIVRNGYVPLLAQRPGAVRAHFSTARFFDLGTPYDYLLAQWALLDDPGAFGFALAQTVAPACPSWPPVLVAPDARLDPAASLGPYAVVGAGAILGPRARLSHGVVWPGASLNEPAAHAIVTPRTTIAVGY